MFTGRLRFAVEVQRLDVVVYVDDPAQLVIRAGTRIVGYQHRKAVAAALKPIYRAPDAKTARVELKSFKTNARSALSRIRSRLRERLGECSCAAVSPAAARDAGAVAAASRPEASGRESIVDGALLVEHACGLAPGVGCAIPVGAAGVISSTAD